MSCLPNDIPLLLKAIIGMIALLGLYYCIKKTESLSPPQATIKAKKESKILNELEEIIPNIENEYHKLGQAAISYPLEKYEADFLLPISNYQIVKKRNAVTGVMKSTTCCRW